ncbi:hypothetical protein JZ785_23070 [Alicyclobacillus curvatus]|nr:hypothetical protein JZ785_23070 [Alicyclobacillus curvatus]
MTHRIWFEPLCLYDWLERMNPLDWFGEGISSRSTSSVKPRVCAAQNIKYRLKRAANVMNLQV